MIHDLQLCVSPEKATNQEAVKKEVAKQLGVSVKSIAGIHVKKKSIDARRQEIKVNLALKVYVGELVPSDKPQAPDWKNVASAKPVLIVGCGPAGLFAALRLLERGLKPIIIERGKDVSNRKVDIARLCTQHLLDPESNFCFGAGGAGTFSDGKLYTRSNKRGDNDSILDIFRLHGADDAIAYEAHPHLGSDNLSEIVKRIANTIIEHGGEIHYQTRMDDLIIQDQCIKGIIDDKGNKILADSLILASGHSARDVYHILNRHGLALEAKDFALGVRVEHPQALIDSIQYHRPQRGPHLPAASYSLVSQIEGRGVYSFCMCPGGTIVPSATAADQIVVNGMSNATRSSAFANSGIVVEVKPEDYHQFSEQGVMAALTYQIWLEQRAKEYGGPGQEAPAQALADFVRSTVSSTTPRCSYLPGTVVSDLHRWLPASIARRLQLALRSFDQKMHGFLTNEALVVGVESRTSSPLRIPRDAQTLQHPQVKGLYPCGEGAGYSGGIISSAIDGQELANRVL